MDYFLLNDILTSYCRRLNINVGDTFLTFIIPNSKFVTKTEIIEKTKKALSIFNNIYSFVIIPEASHKDKHGNYEITSYDKYHTHVVASKINENDLTILQEYWGLHVKIETIKAKEIYWMDGLISYLSKQHFAITTNDIVFNKAIPIIEELPEELPEKNNTEFTIINLPSAIKIISLFLKFVLSKCKYTFTKDVYIWNDS
jgi:hypothetical protein